MQVRGVVVGNIGGDTKAETAVHTNVNTGGTGQFSDVHVFTCAGTTVTRLASAGTGDRAENGVRAIGFTGGRLLIDRFADALALCCPGSAIRQGYTLTGSTLTAAGAPAKRKFVTLNATGPATEVTISFLPGTSGALLSGFTDGVLPGGFDASAGQTLVLAVEAAVPGTPNARLEVRQGSTVLGSAVSGNTATMTLPSTVHYTIVATAVGPTPAGFDAEMTIT
jgi:hypothetical protein